MKIAAHHQPGTIENDISERIHPNPSYQPVQAWPEDCTVQWGHGIIPAVPFFEAFIPGTFIRGEGKDIAEAEERAFAQYIKEHGCDHIWGRQRPGGNLYTNGAGWCRRCKAFRTKMFPPISKLGHMRKPLSISEVDHLHSMETDTDLNERMDRLYPHDREPRKKHKRILQLRLHLFGKVPRT